MLIPFDQIYYVLRKLAKSDYWQNIYSYNKEHSGINVFKNNMDFTHFQLTFLNTLAFYYNLNFDVATGEVPEIVFDNEIYEDSYTHYKNNFRKKKVKETKESIENEKRYTDNYHKEQVLNQNQWVFTKVKGSIK